MIGGLTSKNLIEKTSSQMKLFLNYFVMKLSYFCQVGERSKIELFLVIFFTNV